MVRRHQRDFTEFTQETVPSASAEDQAPGPRLLGAATPHSGRDDEPDGPVSGFASAA